MESHATTVRRLLVVDDERIQRLIVTRAVEPMGIVTESATSLEEAAEHLAAYHYEAIVLDLSLGGSEGISLFQTIRASASDPVLIFISRLDERVLAASMRLATALGLRVAGALRKPVSPSDLRALLRDAPLCRSEATIPEGRPPSAEDLTDALCWDEIVPRFQPKVSLIDGTVVGMEALARWPRTRTGMISPDVFIPLAEKSGQIVKLTFTVLRQALLACRKWRVEHPLCSVSVNLSPIVLADPSLPDAIEQILDETGVGPGALIAEVTESTILANPLVAAEVVTRLRIKGISMSIDDFGTGHSSLLSLLRLPFSELKIDRSFTAQSETDPEAWKIIRATISMARELGMAVVAEGIETQTIANMLRDAGCHIGQGWLFGHAMPENALPAWFAAREVIAA